MSSPCCGIPVEKMKAILIPDCYGQEWLLALREYLAP